MNKNITIGAVVAIAVGIAVAVGVALSSSSEEDAEATTNQDSVAQMDTIDNSNTNMQVEQEDTQVNDSDSVNNEETSNSGGIFTDYNESLVSNAASGDVVLFFHADWCPTCLSLERDIERNLDSIPENVTILKTPYGNSGETAIAREYGVRVQHTLIQVDADGNEIKEWVGSFRLEDLVEEVI